MDKSEILLTILAEECSETAQRASKAIRFGLNEVQSEQTMNNAERIVYEFNDILAVMEVLHSEGCIDFPIDREAIERKKIKIEKYLEYSKQVGALK